MPFAFGGTYNYGIKLDPSKQIKESSIISFGEIGAATIAPNLRTVIPFVNLLFFDDIKFVKEEIKENWDELLELSLPFREYVGEKKSLNFLEKYISNDKNLELLENDEKGVHKTFMDFWNHYNDTPQQKIYSEIITKLVNDNLYLPSFEKKDYGIWNTRLFNALAQRAYSKTELEFRESQIYYWNSLIQPHGFDSVYPEFGVIPETNDSYLTLRGVLNQFDSNSNLERDFSKEILEHPLYEAIQELRVRKRGYMGELHAEAAAILDTKYNDPYASWDALVTASYWAGQAGSKAIEPMWEAAIYLSEKHNWKEIHEVLVQQYEYYNFYKDKV